MYVLLLDLVVIVCSVLKPLCLLMEKHASTVTVFQRAEGSGVFSASVSRVEIDIIIVGLESDSDFFFFLLPFCCYENNKCFCVHVCGSLSEFLAKSDEYVYKLADNLLDAMTNGEHSKTLRETEPVSTHCDI